jgi:hypothetical protein
VNNMKLESGVLGRFKAALAAVAAAFLLAVSGTACVNRAFLVQVPPMLPARYYACQEATPVDLYNAYLSPNARRIFAEQQFNSEVFVFKNIEVVSAMLLNIPKDNIWLGQVICYAANPRDISSLKAGQRYDIVGVNRGVHPEWRFSIYLTECYFLPHNAAALPAGEAPAFVQGY